MKKLLGGSVVFAGVLGLVMALSVGVASADHGDANENSPFAEAEAIADFANCTTTDVASCEEDPNPGGPPPWAEAGSTTPGAIPVGTALGFTGVVTPDSHPGLVHSNGFQNLSHNPNCPLHYLRPLE